MKINQHATNTPEADWVEAAQLDIVMKGLRTTQPAAVVVLLVVCALVARYVSPAVLTVWALAWLALALHRALVVRRYTHLVSHQPVSERLTFLRRHAWIWSAYAATWGVVPLVFTDRLPDAVEVAVWFVGAGAGAVSMSWMSAHMPTVKRYLATLILTLVSSLLAFIFTAAQPLTSISFSILMPLVVMLFWVALLRMVANLHRLSAQGIDLRYQNEKLIQSLRKQTHAAQEALVFRDRFLAGAAHDLKQPINALGIYAEWLSNEPKLVDELSPKILQSTQAINTLFDSLFDLVKLDAGHLEVVPKPIDVAQLLAELEVQFRPLAIQKGLNLRVRVIEATLMSDPIMLRRIISNLITNAIRYTNQGGILLAARPRDTTLVFEVWDTGVGIAEDEQALVFDEFYRVRHGGSDGGFGLGLAIVRRLSATLGLTLSMSSRPGRGSVFRVRAPQSAKAGGAPAGVTSSGGRSFAHSGASESGS